MLTENQKDTLDAGIVNGLITLLASLEYNLQAAIDVLHDIKTQDGFNKQWQTANATQKPILASLHGLYVGQYISINSLDMIERHAFSFARNHIPFNIHLLAEGQSEDILEEIKEYGPKAINVLIQKCKENLQSEQTALSQPEQGWPEYLGRELYDGGKDAVMGFVNPVIHPLDTLKNLGNAVLHPLDTMGGIADHAIKHPVRFGTNMVLSFGISFVVGFGMSKACGTPPPGPSPKGIPLPDYAVAAIDTPSLGGLPSIASARPAVGQSPQVFTPARNMRAMGSAEMLTAAEKQRRRGIDNSLKDALAQRKLANILETDLAEALKNMRFR